MKIQSISLLTAGLLLLSAGGAVAQDKATKEQADKIHQQAQSEPAQEKAVKLFCQAAAMVPKNQEYQNDCNNGRRAMVDSDKRMLVKAQDAADGGKPDVAKRYAGYVSNTDADLYKKAQQLIASVGAPPAPGPAQPAQQPAAPVHTDNSSAMLAQANSNFEGGNLQGAKSAAAQVTDTNLKGMASKIINDVDRYSGLVADGQRNEGSNPQAALSAYESARNVNSHVAGDDLNGKIAHLQQQIAAANKPPPPAQQQTPATPPPTVAKNNQPPPPKPPEPSPEDKKKQFLVAYNAALGRNDAEGQEKALRALVQLDPRDAESKAKLDAVQKQVADQLNRDPAKLEGTLRDAIQAFYASDLDTSESKLNNYLRASGAKKKGVAYFYLGATEQAQAFLQPVSKRASRLQDAKDNFRQAKQSGYQPVQKYVSGKILEAWQQAGL